MFKVNWNGHEFKILAISPGKGLGLSLSYDIVKSYGGELKVETNDGDGSEFSIQLLLI